MFAAPPTIETQVFAQIPEHMRTGRAGSFLEGPSFDRDGNLYVVSITQGRIYKVSPGGEFSVFFEYDGEPNGLKIHKDGRFFIADHKKGLLVLDPRELKLTTLLDRPRRESFKGLNDLVFDSRGDLYFTDQGESGLQDPTGRLWRLRADGRLDLLLDNVPSPNGVVVALDERTVYLAVTRANAVWRVPLHRDGSIGRVGTQIQLSGGHGPDGMAIDSAGNLLIAHVGMGSVWVFSSIGRPVAEIQSCAGLMTTNLAFGGAERKTLYITESATGSILTAALDVAGRAMYSHG